tara:strand:- start:1934 stop:2146 length:213 start_codon:yes stop_codon:yes gene_type:complete
MFWLDYSIEQAGPHFRVTGDTPTEVMDQGLYKVGDVFVVNENGWLEKMGKFEELLLREGHGRDKCTSRGD